MRARNIKPAFFLCEELAEADAFTRLLFIGLWCYADREGRFEWKPKRIKAAIFPYDRVDVGKMLSVLMSLHVITCNDGVGYIINFKKHQSPHPHEAKSVLPPFPEKTQENQCHDMSFTFHEMQCECNADVRKDDSLIPDSKNKTFSASDDAESVYMTKKNRRLEGKRLQSFDQFWAAFDYKRGRAEAADAWLDIPTLTEKVVAQIVAAAKVEASKREELIKQGTTPKMAQGWLSGRRWEDADIRVTTLSPQQPSVTPTESAAIRAALDKYEQ